MPQCVTTRALGDPARPHRLLNRHYPLRLSRRGHICGHIGARILHLEVQRIGKRGVQDAQPK